MTSEGQRNRPEGNENLLPFVLQLFLLLVLSLHAIAVGVWGVAFVKDLARGNRCRGALTSAELNRQKKESQAAERSRSWRVKKLE